MIKKQIDVYDSVLIAVIKKCWENTFETL